MKLNVFTGATTGDELFATAEHLHAGRSTHVLEVRVSKGDADRLAANLLLTQFVLPGRQQPAHEGTRWTSNRFVPSCCSGRPAVIAIRSPDWATPCSRARRAQSSSRSRRLCHSSLSTQRTPNSRFSRRTVSGRGEIASTGTRGRCADTSRAVRPLRVGTTSAASPRR